MAYANGRPPDTTSIGVQAHHPDHVLVGATFGILRSTDGGQSWGWICEEVLEGLTAADPLVAWLSNGDMVVGTPTQLFISHDQGCTWQAHPNFSNLQVTDVVVDSAVEDTFYVTVNEPTQGRLYQTHNNGTTFNPLPVGHSGVYLNTMRITGGKHKRMMAAGADSTNQIWIFRSDDLGDHWTEQPVQGMPQLPISPRLAVSSEDANVVLYGVLDLKNLGSSILRSSDGGLTAHAVGSFQESLRDMVFAPDGQRVWAAGSRHIFYSSDAGQTFSTQAAPVGNACVAYQADRLYACGNTAVDHWALAQSSDGGHTFAPMLSLRQLTGPIACPADTPTSQVCAPVWPQMKAMLAKASVQNRSSGSDKEDSHRSDGGCHCQVMGLSTDEKPPIDRLEGWILAWAAWHILRRSAYPRRKLEDRG